MIYKDEELLKEQKLQCRSSLLATLLDELLLDNEDNLESEREI